MTHHQNDSSPLHPDTAKSLARGLGWFSIALGATEVMVPGALARWLGMRGSEPILRAYGVREIASGIGILQSENPAGWLWGRVAGDGLDIATLLEGLARDDANKGNVGTALMAVLGVTALDVLSAQTLSRQNGRNNQIQRQAVRDYSRRSGFKQPPEAMRGRARDFKVPPDMRTPAPLRPLAH
jgi:hypothetical protein